MSIYEESPNPDVKRFRETHRKRTISLTKIGPIYKDGKRLCAWCCTKEVRFKYCSKSCENQLTAFARPQSVQGLNALLVRQNWKCYGCQFDYMPYVQEAVKKIAPRNHATYDVNDGFHWNVVKKFKRLVPKDRRPEVDHLIPISKLGEAIGLKNHFCLCNTCHRIKTKIDNSGPRNKLTLSE